MQRKIAEKSSPMAKEARVRGPGISLSDLTVMGLGQMNEHIVSPRSEKRMFAQVALKEKQSSVCFFEMASVELQYFLLFDLNVKKVKAGRSKKEGWARKVLNQPSCQVKQQAVMRPGRVTAIRLNIEMEMKFVGFFSERYVIRSMVLLNRVKRQARKMRKKRIVRKPLRWPPSFSTLQGPTFSTLAMPRLAEKIEVR